MITWKIETLSSQAIMYTMEECLYLMESCAALQLSSMATMAAKQQSMRMKGARLSHVQAQACMPAPSFQKYMRTHWPSLPAFDRGMHCRVLGLLRS